MSGTQAIQFRHHQAIWVASIIAFIGTIPLASTRWYLLPVLLVPAVVGLWAWRAGTDVDPAGIRVRALVGQRLIPWTEVVELTGDARGRAVVRLADGRQSALPAVRAANLPRLVAASGQRIG